MLPTNFMVQDILGSSFAVVVFALFLFAPGYLVGFSANAFNFRRLRFVDQALWAVASSFCIAPLTAYFFGKVSGLRGVCWVFAAAGAATVPLLLRSKVFVDWSKRDRWFTAAVVLGCTLLVLVLMVEVQIGGKLYYSVVMADQSYRIAFTDAVVRTGVPPANPLYFTGKPAPMPYYYFWYILCGAVVKVGHVSSRQAFLASSIWAAFGLVIAVKLYARNFFRWGRRTTWVAIGLLLVTGADLLPALGNLALQSSLNGNTEWWSVDQIDAWPDSVLWVPHHVASILCCLFAFLFLWLIIEAPEQRRKLATYLLAGCAAASAFGLSVYVAAGFAILMCAWLGWLLVKRDVAAAAWLCGLAITAALSALLLMPFLRELLVSSAGTVANASPHSAAARHFLWFSVRPLIDAGLITSLPAFSNWNLAHPVFLEQGVRLLLLIPGLAMELGVYGAALVILLIARGRKEPGSRNRTRDTAMFLALAGLVMTMFLSSSVITNNDFGYRAVMLAQFFLTLLTADLIGSWREGTATPAARGTRRRKTLIASLLVLGVAGSIYWGFLLRAWLPIEEAHASSGFNASPEDAFEVRNAFEKLDRIAPASAVVGFRDMDLDGERKDMEVMTPTEFFQRMLVMNIGRQILNAEPKCATHFGGNPSACIAIKQETQELYANPSPSAGWAQRYCKQLGVHYLLFSTRDPAWGNPSGWTSNLPIVVEQTRLKILDCSIASSR